MLTNKISMLLVSPYDEDHRALKAILRRSNWSLHSANTIAESLRLMQSNTVSVILCERDLPDGSWKELLHALAAQGFPQRLIVMSATADDCLCSNVLNSGGFDVLLKPLEAPELFRVGSLADRHWREQARSASTKSLLATAAG
jgi:DNA-binding response OmpR family regulator